MVNSNTQGFIFVNELGQYAVTGVSFDHGPSREVVMWVDGINQAEIFPHEGMMRRKHKSLEKCQTLMAVATRVVSIRDWSEKAAPVMPIDPEEYRPFPPSSLQRPA